MIFRLHCLRSLSYAFLAYLEGDAASFIAHNQRVLDFIPAGYGNIGKIEINFTEPFFLRGRGGHGGRYLQLRDSMQQVRDMYRDRADGDPSWFTAYNLLGFAEATYEYNRLEESEEHAQRALGIGKNRNSSGLLTPASLVLSKIYAAKGDSGLAIQVVNSAIQLATAWSHVHWLGRLTAWKAWLLHSTGDHETAYRGAYNGYLRMNIANLAKNTGKNPWMSEYGDGDRTGLTMATEIVADVRLMQATAWIYWQAVDDVSGAGWGFLSSNLNHPTDYNFLINEKYYVMGQFSKFIRPGSIIVSDTDPHSLAAYDPKQQELVIVETNVTGQPRATRFSFQHFDATGKVDVYQTTRYQHTNNIKHVADLSAANGSLLYTVAPYSVTTLVVPGTLSN